MQASIDLIKRSSETGTRILTTDEDRKMFLMSECQRYGIDMILPPLTVDVQFELFEDIKELLVDIPELVIPMLTGRKILNNSKGGLTMELTKLEQAIALSLFIKEMGLDVASELLGEETIAEVEKESINIVENTTLKNISDSTTSLIEKLANSILTKEE